MINKILTYIASISMDKVLHFIVCYIILDICLTIFGNYNTDTIATIIDSFIVTSIIIFAKEIYDAYQPNNKFDWSDIRADYIGVILKLLVYLIVKL